MSYLIVDTNVNHAFVQAGKAETDAYFYTVECIRKKKLIVLYDERLLEEYSQDFKNCLLGWERAGSARRVKGDQYSDLLEELRANTEVTSDDPHVLAASIFNRVRLLCTDDAALIVDFKKKALVNDPRGKIIPSDADRRSIANLTRSCP